jgi:hypothetical protein
MCMCEEGDFSYLYIWIKFKFIIMETSLSNLINSSIEHVLHSYGLHLVSTYKFMKYVATLALGSWPRQRLAKVRAKKRSLGVTSHAPESAKECEGMNPHTPKRTPILRIGILVDFWIFRDDWGGQNSLHWGVPYIIEKFLECKFLKWPHMTHLDIWNTSYGQKKGWESNW